MSGYANLKAWWGKTTDHDRAEGVLAYPRYRDLLVVLATRFDTTLERAAAVFAALSPNNAYASNMRSAVTVLDAVHRGLGPEDYVVSTYGHCRRRAHAYAAGEVSFRDTVKGPKIRAFYELLQDPAAPHVVIDGHMNALWLGRDDFTMKDAVIRPASEYARIVRAVRDLARRRGVAPAAVQATLWFARKRVLGIAYSGQLDMFRAADDPFGTVLDAAQMPPYPPSRVAVTRPVEDLHPMLMEFA